MKIEFDAKDRDDHVLITTIKNPGTDRERVETTAIPYTIAFDLAHQLGRAAFVAMVNAGRASHLVEVVE